MCLLSIFSTVSLLLGFSIFSSSANEALLGKFIFDGCDEHITLVASLHEQEIFFSVHRLGSLNAEQMIYDIVLAGSLFTLGTVCMNSNERPSGLCSVPAVPGTFGPLVTLRYKDANSAFGLNPLQPQEVSNCSMQQQSSPGGTDVLVIPEREGTARALKNVSACNIVGNRGCEVERGVFGKYFRLGSLDRVESLAYPIVGDVLFGFSSGDHRVNISGDFIGHLPWISKPPIFYPKSDEFHQCLHLRKVILLGDSHSRKIHEFVTQHVRTSVWKFREDGHGVYYNAAIFRNIDAYSKGILQPKYTVGEMLTNLRSGKYTRMQKEYQYEYWVFQSGHWDLRDLDIDTYCKHLDELFREFFVFSQTAVPPIHKLIWGGVPAYSYQRGIFGYMERRTNLKLLLGDRHAKKLCLQYKIVHLPFFDISFPFHRNSCDSHHYLCNRSSTTPMGLTHLELLLQVVCKQ